MTFLPSLIYKDVPTNTEEKREGNNKKIVCTLINFIIEFILHQIHAFIYNNIFSNLKILNYLCKSKFCNNSCALYVGPCFHGTSRPQVTDRGYGLQKWKVAANMLNKQPWTADRGGPRA